MVTLEEVRPSSFEWSLKFCSFRLKENALRLIDVGRGSFASPLLFMRRGCGGSCMTELGFIRIFIFYIVALLVFRP